MDQPSDNNRGIPSSSHENGSGSASDQVRSNVENGDNGDEHLAQAQSGHRPLNSVDILREPPPSGFPGVGSNGRSGGHSAPAPIRLHPDRSSGLPPIGTAEILKDETIILHLRAESADGKTHGDGEIKVSPKDKDYSSIRDHVGEIKEGELKFVSPWVDSSGLPTNSNPVKGDVVPQSGTTGGTTPDAGKSTDSAVPGGANGAAGALIPGKAAVPQILPPGVSFTTDVTTTYNSMSAETRAIIAKSGAKVVAVHHLTDAMPELRGQAPRGWPVGATWDAVDGCWSASKNEIVVTEERQQLSGNLWIPSGRVREVLRHETGHAVDFTIKMLSDHNDFKQAYDDDLQAMPTADKNQLAYFLQSGSAGREETAAEGVADRDGGATGGAAFHRDFSRTLKVINDTLISVSGVPVNGTGTFVAPVIPGGGSVVPGGGSVVPGGGPAVPGGSGSGGPAVPNGGVDRVPIQTY